MFIKIVTYPEEGSTEKVHEWTLECKSYSFHYNESNWEQGTFFIDPRFPEVGEAEKCTSITCTLHITKAYIMSDSGKTIDSFKWSKDGPNKRCVRH